MAVVGHVETDIGDVFVLLNTDGRICGNALSGFLILLSLYCSDRAETDVVQWFSKLETLSEGKLCQASQPLMQSFYSGDWNYSEDDYQWYVHRTQDMQTTKEQFIQTILEINQKWTGAEVLLANVRQLLELLQETELETTPWLDPYRTIEDFQALLETLIMAIRRNTRQVRIRFD